MAENDPGEIDVKGVQKVVIVIGIFLFIFLDRHFKKFLASPPILQPAETPEEGKLVSRAKLACVILFVMTVVSGVVVHESGM